MQLPTKSLKVRDEKDMDTRVFLNDQKFSDRVPNEIFVVSTCEGPPKKISNFNLNICPFAPHICDWLIL